MQNNIVELQKIRNETQKWLDWGDRMDFARKYGVTSGMISSILKGRSNGKKSREKLFEMYEKAMQNKRMLIEKVQEGEDD